MATQRMTSLLIWELGTMLFNREREHTHTQKGVGLQGKRVTLVFFCVGDALPTGLPKRGVSFAISGWNCRGEELNTNC